MIISHEKFLSFRCPSCGHISYKKISMFSFASDRKLSLTCGCGEKCVAIEKTGGKYMMSVLCVSCVENHIYYIPQGLMWGRQLLSYRCPVTGFGVICLGSKSQVRDEQEIFDDEMLSAFEYYSDDFETEEITYDNEKIMFAILDILYNMFNTGKIHCTCENELVKFDIYPDRVYVYCENCDRQAEVMAKSEVDLNEAKNMKSIILE